jgi:hypothetical protein
MALFIAGRRKAELKRDTCRCERFDARFNPIGQANAENAYGFANAMLTLADPIC